MSKKRILCTGNPDNPNTIAYGIRQVFPTAEFASTATGYDLTFNTTGSEDFFKEQLKRYNVLINASYIGLGVQKRILEITNQTWKHGHVVNIGSSSEYDPDNYVNPAYAYDKIALRNLSLKLFSYRFRTTHIVLGGIKNDLPERANWMLPVTIAENIAWAINNTVDIPILGIQQEFDPW
jgi:hypothetical protein